MESHVTTALLAGYFLFTIIVVFLIVRVYTLKVRLDDLEFEIYSLKERLRIKDMLDMRDGDSRNQ